MNRLFVLSSFLLVIGSSSVLTKELTGADVEKVHPWWVQEAEAANKAAYYKRCQSSCTDNSKGVRTRVELCDDKQVCRGYKQPTTDYASEKCSAWSSDIPFLTAVGKQVVDPAPTVGNWISCAVFCKTQSGSWYAPRHELTAMDIDPYFPDGVWCHREGEQDFYCQKNLCLPEKVDYSLLTRDILDIGDESMELEPEAP